MNKAPATTRVDYGPDEPAMQAYFREGEQRALSLPNRGPVHFTKDGRLHSDILASFSHYGFYVLEGLIELAELKDDADLIARHQGRRYTNLVGRKHDSCAGNHE